MWFSGVMFCLIDFWYLKLFKSIPLLSTKLALKGQKADEFVKLHDFLQVGILQMLWKRKMQKYKCVFNSKINKFKKKRKRKEPTNLRIQKI